MATFSHAPDNPPSLTYELGVTGSDILVVLDGSILSNTLTIVDVWQFDSTIEIGSGVNMTVSGGGSDVRSVIESTAMATTISIGLGSVLTQSPGNPLASLSPVISLFKDLAMVTYGAGMDFDLTNRGTISANGARAVGVSSADGGNTITNFGIIDVTNITTPDGAVGIQIASDRDQTGINASNTIVNEVSGRISARSPFGGWAVQTSHDNDTLRNLGVIEGIVSLRGGDDVFENSGSITGNIFLGDGNDRFTHTGNPLAKLFVDGGAGDDIYEIANPTDWTIVDASGTDTFTVAVSWNLKFTSIENLNLTGNANLRGMGSSLANTIVGNDGANFLSGRQGDDHLTGGAGNDILRGREDNDHLDGGADDDLLSGWTGNDTLLGGAGSDRLFGGDGADILNGGAGRDIMFGDAGADTFIFSSAGDSQNGAGRDVIGDFEVDVDTIDLSGVGAGTLGWIGAANFSGTAPEIRVIEVGGNSIASVDADGDGVSDMQIALTGVTGLSATDFVL